jgi:hypothetical protein
MTDFKHKSPASWPLAQVKIVRGRTVERHGSLITAMAVIRPAVALAEAIRIFETCFHL